MANHGQNWRWLDAQPVRINKNKHEGKLTKLCRESGFAPRLGKIDVRKTNHRRRYFEIVDPDTKEIFFHLMGCKTYLISQDKLNVFRLMGCSFNIINR